MARTKTNPGQTWKPMVGANTLHRGRTHGRAQRVANKKT